MSRHIRAKKDERDNERRGGELESQNKDERTTDGQTEERHDQMNS